MEVFHWRRKNHSINHRDLNRNFLDWILDFDVVQKTSSFEFTSKTFGSKRLNFKWNVIRAPAFVWLHLSFRTPPPPLFPPTPDF